MKHLFKTLPMIFMCVALTSAAQNSDGRFLIGFGTQGANMSAMDGISNYYKDWHVTKAAGQIKVFSYIGKGLSWGWQLGVGNAGRTDSSNTIIFLQWGVDIKYSFANGYILKNKSWFDPYFLAGGGLNHWGDTKGSINVGAGLNIWVSKEVGFFGQTQFNYLPHKQDHPETTDPRPSFVLHSFGMVFRIGRGRDTDGDGIPDAEDACPNDPGKAEFKGCPDTDGDGIIDKDDKCPTVAGLPEFQGCPDTDGDGIPDADDACPNEKGPLETKGCPDRDGDGVPDKDDACPDVKGPLATMGCPDRDGDGVPDKDDACPDEPGPAKYKGCPDSDGDGIIDKDDKCPNVYGTVANHGCPVPALDAGEKVEVQKKLSFAAKHIFFESGQDVLKKGSLTDLDSVAAILQRYDFLKVSVEGHTDNVGPDNANVDLSNKRAAAVVKYLISKGILPTRLTASGYGPFKPIADNKTPDGRAKNRRVEINIED